MSPWRVLVVDDEPDVGDTVSELLASYESASDSSPIITRYEQSFDKAVALLVSESFDILVLDIRNESEHPPSNEAGIQVFDEIRKHRFIPIIFYTALPDVSAGISNPPFVQTVSKTAVDLIADLERAVESVISSGLPRLLRLVSLHVTNVERDFMVDFVEQNWVDLANRAEDMAYLLSRRLAVSFEEGANNLELELGEGETTTSEEVIHPTRFYVQPPSPGYKMGDLLAMSTSTQEDEGTGRLFVVLTPSCDLVPRGGEMKANRVVLSSCLPLDTFDVYRKWKESPSNNRQRNLQDLLKSRPRGQEDRYFYLPAAWNVPDVVVDFQSVASISVEHLESYDKIATLDSPFAEALSYQFNRYMGRVGVPDLDIDIVLRRLEDL